MIDVTQIVVALIGLIGVVITAVVVPLIKQKITSGQWNTLQMWTSAAVQAAEVLFQGSGLGADKREYVMSYIKDMCEKYHIKFDEKTVRIALEEAWKTMINTK